jgi:hypothetical protein
VIQGLRASRLHLATFCSRLRRCSQLCDPGAARFALAPGYLLDAPSALFAVDPVIRYTFSSLRLRSLCLFSEC